jgi:phosphate transport system substrate-binding protein
MNRMNIKFACIITMVSLLACNSKSIEKNAPNKTSPESSLIKIGGSDTELNLVEAMVQEYYMVDSSITFELSGGGTSIGFKKSLENELEIINASRLINENEKKLFEDKRIDLIPIMFAMDAIVIITNSKLGVANLTLEQVKQILEGKINNWKEVGGKNILIKRFGRNQNSGTYSYLLDKFDLKNYSKDFIELNTNQEILDSTMNNHGAFGYCSLNVLVDSIGKPNGKVWCMPLSLDIHTQQVTPLELNSVLKGDYPLTRPLYHYIKKPIEGNVKKFILFELGAANKSIISKHGYFPITDYQKEINKLNGVFEL